MKNAYFAIMAIPVIIGVLVVAYMVQEPQESDGITTTGLLSEASPILGSADARITIIEWGDYQCEFCHKFHQNTLGVIKEKYESVKYVNGPQFVTCIVNIGKSDALYESNTNAKRLHAAAFGGLSLLFAHILTL